MKGHWSPATSIIIYYELPHCNFVALICTVTQHLVEHFDIHIQYSYLEMIFLKGFIISLVQMQKICVISGCHFWVSVPSSAPLLPPILNVLSSEPASFSSRQLSSPTTVCSTVLFILNIYLVIEQRSELTH